MSCSGCRVLRKGCSESCILRPCLEWIETSDAQSNATVFVAKFFGRAGLMSSISSVPDNQRPDVFQSLLFEAAGRTVNPVNGALGLLWTGNWHVCQAAVETVLQGGALRPIPEFLSDSSLEHDNISECTDMFKLQQSKLNSPPKVKKRRLGSPEAGIFLVTRILSLFIVIPYIMNLISFIGIITVLLGAILALVQKDIKSDLTYSTMSQLDYMMLSLGRWSYRSALFHLITHAYSKALLFLGSESINHSMETIVDYSPDKSENIALMETVTHYFRVTIYLFIYHRQHLRPLLQGCLKHHHHHHHHHHRYLQNHHQIGYKLINLLVTTFNKLIKSSQTPTPHHTTPKHRTTISDVTHRHHHQHHHHYNTNVPSHHSKAPYHRQHPPRMSPTATTVDITTTIPIIYAHKIATTTTQKPTKSLVHRCAARVNLFFWPTIHSFFGQRYLWPSSIDNDLAKRDDEIC
ncbi:LOB domain-containing 37, partial [Olea europaea subsp. europaea]